MKGQSTIRSGVLLAVAALAAGCGGAAAPLPPVVAHAGLERILLYVDGLA